MQELVIVDCPTSLLEVLFARQAWQLAILPNIPLLDVAHSEITHRALNTLTVAERIEQCECAWAAFLAWRSEMHKAPDDAPPTWRSKYGYADLDERAMRDFVGQARKRTMTELRRHGPVTVGSLRSRFGERMGVSAPDEFVLHVLPLDRRLQMQVAPTIF